MRMLRRTSTLALWEKPEGCGLVQPGQGIVVGGSNSSALVRRQETGSLRRCMAGEQETTGIRWNRRTTKSYKAKINQHPDILRTVKQCSRLPREAVLSLSGFQTPSPEQSDLTSELPLHWAAAWTRDLPRSLSTWIVLWSGYPMAASQMPTPLLQVKYGNVHLIRKLSENVNNCWTKWELRYCVVYDF